MIRIGALTDPPGTVPSGMALALSGTERDAGTVLRLRREERQR